MTRHRRRLAESSLPASASGHPIVAIVGRPNVGKSTLFNRLARAKLAIVHDEPGVTRDRHYASTMLYGRPIVVVDTGGYDPEDEDPMKTGIARHVREAIKEADVIVFHAGTAEEGGRIVTAGGRVLAVSAYGEDIPRAVRRSLRIIDFIGFDGMYHRRDIGHEFA